MFSILSLLGRVFFYKRRTSVTIDSEVLNNVMKIAIYQKDRQCLMPYRKP